MTSTDNSRVLHTVYQLDNILAHKAIRIIQNMKLHSSDIAPATNDYSTLHSNEHLDELLLLQYLKKLSSHLGLYNSKCSPQMMGFFVDVVMLHVYNHEYHQAVVMLYQFEK